MEDFWFIIVLILTGCVVILTYYLAIVLKTVAERLRETKSIIENVDKITENVLVGQKSLVESMNSFERMVLGVEESFNSLREQFMVPLMFFISIFDKVRGYIQKDDNSDDNLK